MVKSNYSLFFWVNESGQKPVAEWMKELPSKDKVYFAGLFRDLATDGPTSRPKAFKHLEGALWEVRDLRRPGPGYRVYFVFDGHSIVVVVAAGNKDSQERDINLAKQRLKEIQL